MNQDQKTAFAHDAIQALGLLIAALPQAFVSTPWGHFISALPGVLGYLYGAFLSYQYNATTPPAKTFGAPPAPVLALLLLPLFLSQHGCADFQTKLTTGLNTVTGDVNKLAVAAGNVGQAGISMGTTAVTLSTDVVKVSATIAGLTSTPVPVTPAAIAAVPSVAPVN